MKSPNNARQGLIAELRINDSVRLTFEYEGDLEELFKRIDDTFESYRKIMESRYPYEGVLKRSLRRMKRFVMVEQQ